MHRRERRTSATASERQHGIGGQLPEGHSGAGRGGRAGRHRGGRSRSGAAGDEQGAGGLAGGSAGFGDEHAAEAGGGWDSPVVYERHRGVLLSEVGRRRALEVLRHHRLLETFLYEVLDYPIDEVHDEAERLEHFISSGSRSGLQRSWGTRAGPAWALDSTARYSTVRYSTARRVHEGGKVKVLVLGGGGREHALVWALRKSARVSEVVCAPGNAGIARLARCVVVDGADVAAVVALCEQERPGLVVVGPEIPLAVGVVDALQVAGVRVFGPTRAAARLETSKGFARSLWGVGGSRRRGTGFVPMQARCGGPGRWVRGAGGGEGGWVGGGQGRCDVRDACGGTGGGRGTAADGAGGDGRNAGRAGGFVLCGLRRDDGGGAGGGAGS